MNNCLITKLNCTISNPNLPVLETMQQFTLNVIAASGNSNMTDDQKWALNHFFYQIGAINNNGIFAKTKYLFLPMICNEDKDKLLVNYKDNVAITMSSTVKSSLAFDTYHCPYNTNSGRLTQELTTSESTDCSDMYFACGFPEMLSSGNIGVFRAPTSPATIWGLTQGAEPDDAYVTYINNVQYKNVRSTFGNIYGTVATTYDGNYYTLKIGQQNVEGTRVSSTESIPTVPFTLNVQFANPIGLIMWGSHLTEQETTNLANAIRELVLSFAGIGS